MGKISDVFGKSLKDEVKVDDDYHNHNLDQDQDIFEPGSHQAKLQEARAIPIRNGNGKDKSQVYKKKGHIVQKCSQFDLIAEAAL